MTEIVRYQNIQIHIIRSACRKTIAIQIKAGQVSMLVPQSLPKTEIERLLIKKSRWITEKLHFQAQINAIKPKQFIKGEKFSCLGQDYDLEVAQGSSAKIHLYQNQLVAIVRDKQADNSALIKRLLMRWYQAQAEVKLLEKTEHYAKIIGVTPTRIVVKTFKARWGSCSAKGDIHYNWKIIMATNDVVDYVVIHELCHILHHNHSPQFWKTVEFHLPAYREYKAWLKLNGNLLEI
jgi:predicted metal-dependent hydrolase